MSIINKKTINNTKINQNKIIEIIKKTKINNFYLKNNHDFRDRILKDINISHDVLDVGKCMREKFNLIKSRSILTLDINKYRDYPNIICDLCEEIDSSLKNKFDRIICLSILEHVYNPFNAVKNLYKILKKKVIIFGYVPFIYYYHAPEDLKFQDFFRFTKDSLSYLFKDFKKLEIFPVRGRISTPLNILFAGRWKKYVEKSGINIFLDKFASDKKNSIQSSGYNFIAIK